MGGAPSSPNRRKSRQRILCLADVEIGAICGSLPLLLSRGLHLRPYPFNRGGTKKKNRSNQEIKDSATPHIHLNNPCEAGAERCQGGVDLWFDIAMKSAHYLKPICLHIENRELDNLLIFFQGFTYQGFLSSSCRIKDEATTLLLLLVLYTCGRMVPRWLSQVASKSRTNKRSKRWRDSLQRLDKLN